MRNEQSRKSVVFVTGGRIGTRISPRPPQSFRLSFSSQNSLFSHNMTNRGRNPSLDAPPDFQSAGYTLIRQALIAQKPGDENDLDDEGAARQLLDAWEEERQTRQAAWDEAAAEGERERAEAEAERLREEDEMRKGEEKKRKTKFPTLILGTLPQKDSGFRPDRKAITRLENLEFVELWFFTFAGCQTTKNANLSEGGTLSIMQENGNIRLRRSSTMASYQHLIVPDESLSWKDLLQGKSVFLECIAKGGWAEIYLEMFTNFYCTLELRSELRQAHGFGERILVLYHARARREWFASAQSSRGPFDISIIEDDWMTEARKEMWDNVHMQEIRKVKEEVMWDLISYENSTLTILPYKPLMLISNITHPSQPTPMKTVCLTLHIALPLHSSFASRFICFMLHHLTASCINLLRRLMPQPLYNPHSIRFNHSTNPIH